MKCPNVDVKPPNPCSHRRRSELEVRVGGAGVNVAPASQFPRQEVLVAPACPFASYIPFQVIQTSPRLAMVKILKTCFSLVLLFSSEHIFIVEKRDLEKQRKYQFIKYYSMYIILCKIVLSRIHLTPV